MRKRIAAGNWKMNLRFDEAVSLVNDVLKNQKTKHNIIFAPPFPYLKAIAELCSSYPEVYVAAQNCSNELSGAYTGEVSVGMLESIGVTHVIIGHSERRNIFNETDSLLQQKVDLALQNNLTPVFCCGEKIADRNQLRHFKVVEQQLWNSLFHLDEATIKKCIIAYEPVWAIGTGVTATPAQAQEMHAYIRNLISEKYSPEVSAEISILYGGSCNEKNAAELFALPDVDGGLIGGASLKSDSFVKIIQSL